MKNYINKIIATLIIVLGVTFLGGCIKEGNFDTPPTPSANLTANMTLAQFNKFYNDSIVPAPNSGFGEIKQDIIIQGIVVANDAGGNIYKTIYIEDSTGGVDIALNQTYLYNTYTLGQRIYIKCKGLYLGNYGGLIELGYVDNSSGSPAIGRIPSNLIKNYLFTDGFPQGVPVPRLLTMPALANSELCTLVELDSVSFLAGDVGQLFSASAFKYGLPVIDKSGNSITVYNSSYAEFISQPVPSGVGSIVGILTSFKSSTPNQLVLRTISDLKFGKK